MKNVNKDKIEAYFADELEKISQKTNLKYKISFEKKFPFVLSVEFQIPKNVSIVAVCEFEKCTSHRDKLKYALQNFSYTDQTIVLKNDVFKDFCVFEDYFHDMCLSNEKVGNKSDDYYYGLFTLPLDKNTFLNKSKGETTSQYKTMEQISLKALKDFHLLGKMASQNGKEGGFDISTYPDVWKYLNCNLINFKNAGKEQYRMIPLSLIVAMLSELNKDQHIVIVLDVCREIFENVSNIRDKQKKYPVYPKNSSSPIDKVKKSRSKSLKKESHQLKNEEFVTNPLTGRRIKVGGKVYQELLAKKIL